MAENKEIQLTIPYIVHEATQTKNERTIKRLVIALIVAIILIFATNCIWLCYISQYDFYSEEITLGTDGDGNTNYIGENGDINNGVHSSSQECEN